MKTATTKQEARALFLQGTRIKSIKVVAPDGTSMEVDCYPSAVAFFNGERDPAKVYEAGA